MKDMTNEWAKFPGDERPRKYQTREEMLDSVETWTQGKFIETRENRRYMDPQAIEAADRVEAHLLRTGPRENALARFQDPADAKWVAKALRERVQLARELARSERQLANVSGYTKQEANEMVRRWFEMYPLAAKYMEEQGKDDEFMQATLAQAERYGEINRSDMERFLAIVRKHYPRPLRETMEEFQARNRVHRPGQKHITREDIKESKRIVEANSDVCLCQGFHQPPNCPLHGDRLRKKK